MSLTLDKLFEAYMNTGEYEKESLDFAEDIYNFFGLEEDGIGAEEFSRKYATYFPTYDPTADKFAFQDKYLSFRNAQEVQRLADKSTEEVYSQEMDKISGKTASELKKGREVAGGLGLRSGSLESALENTLTASASDATDLSRRLLLQDEENRNVHNVKLVDATLDYDKDIHENKQEFYDRVMAQVMRLVDIGAFDADPVETGVCWENADIDYYDTCVAGCQSISSRRPRNTCIKNCKDDSGATNPEYGIDADGSTIAICP